MLVYFVRSLYHYIRHDEGVLLSIITEFRQGVREHFINAQVARVRIKVKNH